MIYYSKQGVEEEASTQKRTFMNNTSSGMKYILKKIKKPPVRHIQSIAGGENYEKQAPVVL